MCEFLKGDSHKDVRKIKELTELVNAEKHVCDALFAVLTDMQRNPSSARIRDAVDLYSRLLLARSSHDFSNIEDIAHMLTGETK